MKPFKLTSAHKIVAFLVVSVLIVSAITLAVDGWSDTPKEPDSSDVGDNTDQADENKDGIKPPVEEPPSDVETPSTDNSNGTDTDIPTDNIGRYDCPVRFMGVPIKTVSVLVSKKRWNDVK